MVHAGRWLGALLCAGLSASAWAQRTPSATDPKAIVAETQQMSRKQGMVRIGGVLWKCSDKLCVATSKRASTSVNSCQALAELVGSLSRFGRVERPIASYDLALCNVRAQIKLARIEQQQAAAKARQGSRTTPRRGPKPLGPEDDKAPPLPGYQPAPEAPANGAGGVASSASRGVPPVVESVISPRPGTAASYKPPLYSMRVSALTLVGRGNSRAVEPVAPATNSDSRAPAPRPVAQQTIAVTPLTLAGLGRLVEPPAGSIFSITVEKLHVVGQTSSEPQETQ